LDLDGGNADGHNHEAGACMSAEDTREALVNALVFSHVEANKACERARKTAELGVFVTPRHFIEAVKQFASIHGEKKGGIEGQQLHLSVGLEKLTQTHSDVEALARSLANREQQVYPQCVGMYVHNHNTLY
jgi:hypothetical protein